MKHSFYMVGRRIMKNILKILYYIVLALLIIGAVVISLTNPDMTEVRLLLTYWYYYLIIFVWTIISLFFEMKLS